jgi:transposase InsO family protein
MPDIAPPRKRNEVIGVLGHFGPLSVPALKRVFSDIAKRELAEIRTRILDVARRKGLLAFHLEWLKPGTVWGMDFTDPPAPVDDCYPDVLSVRDLASKNHLEVLGHRSQESRGVIETLESLFIQHGAPLVMKSDIGSPFSSAETQEFLSHHGVVSLLSPPCTPRYNGACEAGIGGLKTRAHHVAAARGQPGRWSSDDLEQARLAGNSALWDGGTSPDERFCARSPITAEDREAFLALVETEHEAVFEEASRESNVPNQRAARRLAIERALVKHGLLNVRRRWITPRIQHAIRSKIS